MTPGFERKVRNLAHRMNGLDPVVRLGIGSPIEHEDTQACPFDVTYPVGGKPRKYSYLLVDQEPCVLVDAGTHEWLFEPGPLSGEAAPGTLLAELASRCLLDQLAAALPKQLKKLGCTLASIDFAMGEFSVTKGKNEYAYAVNVEIKEFRGYTATLETEDEEWIVPIPLRDMQVDPLVNQVINDPELSTGWAEQRREILEYILPQISQAGLGAILEDKLRIGLDCDSSATIEIKRSAPDKFEVTLDLPSPMSPDSQVFRDLAKATAILDGLTPIKILEELRRERQDRLKSPPAQEGMESSLSLI